MELLLETCKIRSWRKNDAEALTVHADNRKIWRNLRDAFPHPYTLADAHRFIETALKKKPETYFCIEKNGEAVGSIGLGLHTDVERFSAEIGYWLSERYWGCGIMSEVLKAVTEYAVQTFTLRRVYALPYAWNGVSFRVLEKAGYILEGRLRCSAFKDGSWVDQMMYAYVVVP
ncbi:MAG: GNAT family N-acetyltransferase [Candidatus Aminicenantes bacterium]|nr:GNAT family N-acetyltransferase [Candidatus Aminicenantes bacterium]